MNGIYLIVVCFHPILLLKLLKIFNVLNKAVQVENLYHDFTHWVNANCKLTCLIEIG